MRMMDRLMLMALTGFALTAVTTHPATAQVSKCTGTKAKAAGKKAGAKTSCFAKALDKGVGTDSTCLAKAEVKFSSAVAKAEAKVPGECLTTDDRAMIEAKIDALLDDLDALVADAPPNQSKCDAAKVKAAGKKADAKLGCHAKAVTKGLTADSTCLAKAEVKFSSAVAKAEVKAAAKDLPCSANGDFAAYESLVDSTVADVMTEIRPSTTSTTTIGGGTTTTSTTMSAATTTSTTVPAQVTCGPNGLDVTAHLVYEPRLTGGIYGMFLLVNYPTSVSIPESGTHMMARARFTNLIGTAYRFIPSDVDTNANGVDDQGRTLVTSNSGSPEIPSAPIERIRFDCGAGTIVQTAQFGCVVDQPSDSSGQAFPPAVAAQFSCALGFAPA